MKCGFFLFLLFLTQKAFALYGANILPSTEAFVVSLELRDQQNPEVKYFCNGVLISPTKILTAGHCIDSLGVELYEMSHALIYNPRLFAVKVHNRMMVVKDVELAPSYFDSAGFGAEDLAIIELHFPVTHVKPIKLLPRLPKSREAVTLIARGKKVAGTILVTKKHTRATVLFIDKASGTCQGDSGGAIVVHENGEPKLAGILMYHGEGNCERKTGYGYFPKARF